MPNNKVEVLVDQGVIKQYIIKFKGYRKRNELGQRISFAHLLNIGRIRKNIMWASVFWCF